MKLDFIKAITLINAVVGAAHAMQDTAGIPFEDSIKALSSLITPTLPEKSDKSPYTDQDILDAANAARQPLLRAKALLNS